MSIDSSILFVEILFKYFLGQYLVEKILKRDDLELSFVWNRTVSELRGKVDEKYILENLLSFSDRFVNWKMYWYLINGVYPVSDAGGLQKNLSSPNRSWTFDLATGH